MASTDPNDLRRYEGLWVLVRGAQVLAAAYSSRQLAYERARMGEGADGAVARFVRPRSDALLVGVG